jgi:hypothetical protein
VYFTGPSVVPGGSLIVNIGPYADGLGEAPWRVYDAKLRSVYSGVILGKTGSGKGRIVENLVISETSLPLVFPVVELFIDPQAGMSSPALQAYADWYEEGTADNGFGEVIIDQFAAWAEKRAQESATIGWKGFTPIPCSCPDPIAAMQGQVDHLPYPNDLRVIKAMTPGPGFCMYRPIIGLTIDEAQDVWKDKRLAALCAELTRKIRKIGMFIRGISQTGNQGTFGNQEALRASLVTGNAVVLNMMSNIEGGLIPGLDGLDPRTLPTEPGYLYTVRNDEFARTAPARNRDMSDPATGEDIAMDWMLKNPRLTVDPLLMNIAGEAYRNRRANTSDEARAGNLAQLNAIRAGDATAIAAARRSREQINLRAQAIQAAATPAVMQEWLKELDIDTELDLPNPWDFFPTQREDTEATGATETGAGKDHDVLRAASPTPTGPIDLGDKVAGEVFRALQAGNTKMAELVAATGYSDTTIRKHLRTFQDAEWVTSPKQGTYLLTTKWIEQVSWVDQAGQLRGTA